MRSHRGRLLLASIVCSVLATRSARAQDSSSLSLGFSDHGIASLKWNGTEVLHPGLIEFQKLDLRHGFPPGPTTLPTNAEPTVTFDQSSRELTQTYPWGKLHCTYTAVGDRLTMHLRLENTNTDSIFGFTAKLLELQLPGPFKTKSWMTGWPTPSVMTDAMPIVHADWHDGSLAICNEQVDRPLLMDLQPEGGDRYALAITHDGPPRGAEISSHDSREFDLSIRFGPVGTTSDQLAHDINQRYAQRYPFENNWTDRRPIGCNFVASMDTRSPTNPTGWLDDKTVDMTTDAGRADWKKRTLARFDKSVSVAKEMGCQGVIVWDIEGQRNPQPISYIGDPRLLPQLSPEMDAIADECFKKYTDAGLRCGVTLRPTHVVRTPGGSEGWEHINVEDIAAEIEGKLAYAHQRWGCTLFYVDSTVRWDLSHDGQFMLHTIPAEIFQTIHERFPDVLLIPEESSVRHFAYAAPYHEIMPPQGYTMTPPEVRAIYPKAFSMIRVADAPLIEQDTDALAAAVRNGDIIMFRTWSDDPDNVPVRKILAKAAQP